MNNENFEIENGVLIKYKGNDKTVVIPDSVGTIGDYAFENCESLISIVIGDNVGEIGTGAFSGCSSLISVVIGDNVDTIGEGAFNSCYKLTSIVIPDCPLFFEFSFNGRYFKDCISLNYNIKDGLKYLGNRKNPYVYLADVENSNITTANIDDNCKLIGAFAFSNCKSLTSVTIGNSVDDILGLAFSGCVNLTSITIPNSVRSISPFAFEFCTNLIKVNYLGTIDEWVQIDFVHEPDFFNAANPLCYGANLYINDVLVTDVNITNATSIDDCAFFNCSSITSIKMSTSVTIIKMSAFEGCGSLISVEIPNSVTWIGSYAFKDCSSLTSIKYNGTKEQWKKMFKGFIWNYDVPATYVTCTDGTVTI